MNSSNQGSSVSASRPRFRPLRRIVLALAVIGTLTALFYAVEDWRGRAAWEKCKSELEAKGLSMQWAKYIPADSVPDAENFFKAPKMQEWFVRHEPGQPPIWGEANAGGSNPVTVVEVNVILSGAGEKADKTGGVLQMDDPSTQQQAEKLVRDAIGPHICGAQGYLFVLRRAEDLKPLRIILRTDKTPGTNELAALFSETALAPDLFVHGVTSALKVQPTGSNSFRVILDPAPTSAAAFLAATDKKNEDTELLRAALKRPYARPEGNFASPATQPVVNFVQVRFTAQLFSERAQCHMMLGQPQAALEDLTVLDGLCRMLEFRPSGQNTLVGPMINVAVRGLYAQIVADGIRLGAWREPQLTALEEQLQPVNLPPQVRRGYQAAGASFCDLMENFTAAEYARTMRTFNDGGAPRSFWDYAADRNFWVFALMPRGWRYQSMVRSARAHAIMDEGFDAEGGMLNPAKTEEVVNYVKDLGRSSYGYFAARFIPNYRGVKVASYNQTLINEALVACALERYRIAEGKYPETLDVLAPRFIEKIPKDIIGGKPLIYHRTDDGKFMLYSVGWNQKDDGGATTRIKTGTFPPEAADWVWLNCAE